MQVDTFFSDHDAANIFQNDFSSNFSAFRSDQTTGITEPAKEDSLSKFNCSITDILNAIHSCPNFSSSPDSISCRPIKVICDVIYEPFTITYQHFLHEGVFPDVWKEPVIIPLYKDKRERDLASSYKPISLCQCCGKILEKVIYNQLSVFINSKAVLSTKQHGFVAGRSTLTNLLQSEATFRNFQLRRYPYDVIAFDFEKAFDKVPHPCIIRAVQSISISGPALK